MSSKTATSSSNMAAETDSKRIEYVQVYQAKLAMTAYRGYKIRLYNVLFMIGYIVVGGWVVSTIGQPYRQFLEKADREGFQVMEGATKFRAELEHSVRGLNDPDRRTEKLGWFAWMDMDIEELAAEKKRDKEKSVLDSIPKGQRVPAKHAAGFWPSLVLGIVTCFHALVLLLQHWSVGWNVRMNYREMDAAGVQIPESMMELSEDELEREMAKSSSNGTNTAAASSNNNHASAGSSPNTKDAANTSLLVPDRVIRNVPAHLPTHARICPTKKGQRHVLIPLEYYPVLGMTFEYHRRRYVYDGETDAWHKIRCRTTGLNLEVLAEDWTGLESPTHIISGQIRHGPNMFSVRQPAFWDLYQRQLLNPFSVFQIFCVLLWAIDDYILYSCFSLWMVLMFEGTVVFQRIKSLQALTGMGNPSRHVYAYRCKRWIQLDTTELLPADICSLTRHKPHMAKAGAGTADKKKDDKTKNGGDEETRALAQKKKPPPRSMKIEDEGGDIVPADLLLLRGCTVVNEASLTGESVPQMKEGLSEISPGETLAVKGQHKMNVVYAGTKMLQCQGETTTATASASDSNSNTTDESRTNDDCKTQNSTAKLYAQIPDPPDGGCVCFVLRTGFASAQGKLVRMIEGSQEKVKGHERETGLLLLLLCFFAVCSSSYVLYHGIHQENRSKYELLLHCIMIVTSVIRPELPMQMALAVNNSLMTLMKMHVFCTEPYRVPVAGKLDACLFDKTGTLTTDELAAVGVCEPDQLNHIPKTVKLEQQQGENDQNESDNNNGKNLLTPMAKVSAEAALVLAGCHSLVQVDGETVGDPLESAALKAMRWHVDPGTGKVVPNIAADPAKATSLAGKPIRLRQLHAVATGGPLSELTILTRHHFSSKLQRMSCVVRTNTGHSFAVAKGSPEAIGKLLAKNDDVDDENGVNPALDRYMAAAEYFAKQGYRVICLACKCLSSTPGDVQAARDARSECERDLVFCGLIAFACMVRKDTKQVLARLKQGGMTVSMVTGDAILTAIHVAKLTGIYEPLGGGGGGANGDGSAAGAAEEQNQELRALLESKKKGKSGHQQRPKKQKSKPPSEVFRPILYLDLTDKGALYWAHYEDGTKAREYRAADIPTLAETYDLATTGKCLAAAYEHDADTTKQLMHVKVFARMTPDAKETVIEHLHAMDKLCLMCGDGANDVGALKQADVGVALLSGFGNLNVDKSSAGDDEDKKDKEKKGNAGGGEVTAIMSREVLEELRAMPVGLLKWKIRSIGVDPNKYPDLVEKEDLVQLYQIKARELAVKRHDAKNAKEKSKLSKREQQEEQRAMIREKQARMQRRAEELAAAGESFATFKALREFMSSEMAEAKAKKGELARMHGVEGSAATLAAKLDQMETNELPMVKLGDASIAAPFTSKMPSVKSCVDIVRQGRCTLVSSIQMYQIMALQCLISSYSLSVLYLDGVKYGDSQLTAMGLLGMVSFMSVSRSKPLDKLSRVRPLNTIFHPALFCSLLGQFAIHLSTMVLAVRTAKSHLPPDFVVDLDGEFKPGILNTTVFLVSGVQQVTVFFVNLQGRPFMTGITENRPLLWSLAITFILTFMFASETVPGLNRYFQLVPFPDQGFRDFLLILLVLNLAATFAFDRLMQFFFARDILRASVEGTKWSDVFGLIRTFAVIGIIMQVFLGNSETWDQLLEMEKEMEEMATAAGEEANGTATATATATLEHAANLVNATVNASAAAALDAVGEAVTECVGAACAAAAAAAAAMNETASAVVREEL